MGDMKKQNMDEKIGIRIPKAWKIHLEALAKKGMPGTNICDLVRDAIFQAYFSDSRGKK